MSQSKYTGPRMPKTMSALVNGNTNSRPLGAKYGKGPQTRTERRKLERQQKKTARTLPKSQPSRAPITKIKQNTAVSRPNMQNHHGKAAPPRTNMTVPKSESEEEDDVEDGAAEETNVDSSATSNSELENESDGESDVTESPPPPQMSKTVRDRLAQDDADIAALERRLGIKKKKGKKNDSLDGGLEDLFGDLGDFDDSEAEANPKIKRKLEDDEEWLRQKRRKVQGDELDFEGFSDGSSDEPLSADDMNGSYPADDDEDAIMTDDQKHHSRQNKAEDILPRKKENPYVAPTMPGEQPTSTGKYVPPSLRSKLGSEDETMVRLNRRIQGLINRLSESNLLSILQSVEDLYKDNARQHVTSGIINTLLSLIAESSTLSDVFLVLHGAFIAALYRILGADFGAQLLERVVVLLEEPSSSSEKKPVNLVSLLAVMYSFQVINCDIIYDLIRRYIERFSEDDTELLLRLIRLCGPQLRQDDPSTLKDIVSMVQAKASEKAANTLSVRQSFMVETINDLKNNRLRSGMASSASRLESTARMRKLLGTVKSQSSKASEPLRLSLEDIQNSDKKGKWWLVGASYHDPAKMAKEDVTPGSASMEPSLRENGSESDLDDNGGQVSLPELARQQGMNTDIRRAIFVAIMSAVDYKHALMQVNKLHLKKTQMEEIAHVLLRCTMGENVFNPYYSFVARELCENRQVKMKLQFALWDYFKLMDDQPDVDGSDDDEQLDVPRIVKLASFYAKLIRSEALPITVLKKIDFVYLQPKTSMFLEVLLTSIILDKTKSRSSSPVDTIFATVADVPDMVSGFRFFLQNVVAVSDVPQKQKQKTKVAEVCGKSTKSLSRPNAE
ncbi:hypothetical protein ANO11243_045940 [Dothideomycetidae sp. 11243]|nr:hypothetical protein ANO11243_045940 [fungal sp. No.11243]